MIDTVNNILRSLDKLREEKRELEYFLSGSGDFGVSIDMKLFKFFACGHHELRIRNSDTKDLIFKILNERLKSIDLEVVSLIKKSE